MDFIRQQVKVGFQVLQLIRLRQQLSLTMPIWAIGTGKTATTEQAQEVCADIRKNASLRSMMTLQQKRDPYPVRRICNAATAPDLFAQADIDGGLVGGASLKPDFGKIVNYK